MTQQKAFAIKKALKMIEFIEFGYYRNDNSY